MSATYSDSDGFDHDSVRCDLMADVDCSVLLAGERGTCCVCVNHDCDEANREREKHPASKEASE